MYSKFEIIWEKMKGFLYFKYCLFKYFANWQMSVYFYTYVPLYIYL